jgi:integrase
MLLLRPTSRNYYAVIYRDGKHRWISLGTANKADARALHDSIEARSKAQGLRSRVARLMGEKTEAARPLMIADVEKKYRKVNPNFSQAGLWILRQFREWLDGDYSDISDIDTAKAMQYLDSLTCSGKWFNNQKSALSKIWTVLKPFTNIEKNIWHEIPNRPAGSIKFRPFTRQEVKKFIAELKGDVKDAAIIAYRTGLRKKDVFTLLWENVKNDCIDIIPAKTARYNRAVWVPLHPEARAVLKRLRKKKTVSPYVFPENYKRFNKDVIPEHIRGGLRRAGIKDTNKGRAAFHSLRATFITEAEAAGIPRHVIQGIVGHRSPLMTEHYSQDRQSAKAITLLK